MIPIEEEKWHELETDDSYEMPPGHRMEYARLDDGIVVRITGPNAHVWGKSTKGAGGLERAARAALNWFVEVGEEL